MTSVITSPQYPFDPAGTAATNLITGELQALSGVTGHDYYFIIPQATPFFEDSLQLVFKATTGEIRPLTKGVDYYPTHYFIGASRACGKEIYGSITFLNLTLRGSVTLRYQTVGGEWTVDTNKIAEILGDQLHNPRITSWEQVQDMPVLFPVIDHEWNLVDMVGMKSVVDAINLAVTAIANTGTSITTTHLHDYNNPHQVTAAQLGAVTDAQVDAKVQLAVQQYGGGSTDNLTEGSSKLFFTEDRVNDTKLSGLDSNATGLVVDGDAMNIVISKLQSQILTNKDGVAQAMLTKVNVIAPTTTGMAAEHLEKFNITTSPTQIDLSKGSSFQGLVKASTTIVFKTDFVFNATGNVVAFALTLVNDGVGGWAVSWPANVQWAGHATPPRTTTPNSKDTYYFYSEDGMATWMGSLANEDVG